MRYHELFGLLDDTFAKYRKEECSPESKWTLYCYYKKTKNKMIFVGGFDQL